MKPIWDQVVYALKDVPTMVIGVMDSTAQFKDGFLTANVRTHARTCTRGCVRACASTCRAHSVRPLFSSSRVFVLDFEKTERKKEIHQPNARMHASPTTQELTLSPLVKIFPAGDKKASEMKQVPTHSVSCLRSPPLLDRLPRDIPYFPHHFF